MRVVRGGVSADLLVANSVGDIPRMHCNTLGAQKMTISVLKETSKLSHKISTYYWLYLYTINCCLHTKYKLMIYTCLCATSMSNLCKTGQSKYGEGGLFRPCPRSIPKPVHLFLPEVYEQDQTGKPIMSL